MPRPLVLACAIMTCLLTAARAEQAPTPPPSSPPPATQQESAQPQAGQEQPPPVFRTGTNVVRVDVSVLDKDGNPVRSLNADDFELRENGELQSISSFKLVEASGQPTDDLSLPIRSPQHAATEAARDDVRVFLIFWDEYHIEQFGSALRAREQLTRFVLDAFGPTDLVGLMDQLTPVSALRFSRDRRALADQVHLLRGRRGLYVPARSAVEEAHLRQAQDVERIRSQVTATALKSAVMHLGSLRQGRKAVLFVSEGLGRLGQDGFRVMSDLIRTSNDNNTAIYTIDPRGLQAGPGLGSGMSSLLAALADSTGAEPIVSNDMTSALRKVVANASAFYLLGYSPRDNQLDGKFREIKVRVKQSGVQVRARNGYWAPRVADLERARAVAAAVALPSPVAKAFRELTPEGSRNAADVWVGLAPGAEAGAVDVRVAWASRPGLDSRAAAASVSLTASIDGDRLFEGAVGDSGLLFTARPGTVQLDFTFRDSLGDEIDRDQRRLVVPDPTQTTLALTTPLLSRARSAAELRALSVEATPTPFAGREFSRTDRLLLRVMPYGSAAADAAVTAQLLGPRGATLADLPVKTIASGAGHQLDLPLSSLAAGEFVISVVAKTATERVETLVPIRVGR